MDKYPIQRIVYNERFCNAKCLRKVEYMHGIMQLHAIHYRSLLHAANWPNSIVHGVDETLA